MASTRTYGGKGTPVDEQSLGELVATATRDLSLLVQQEIELAKTEIGTAAATAGVGAGLLGVAGVFAFFALVVASIAGGYGFSRGLGIPVWAGFLCMTGVYLFITLLLAFVGIRRMKKIKGPERTKATVKANLAILKRPSKSPVTKS